MKKILLICVTSQNVITFRKSLIISLQSKGYSVSVIAFDREYEDDILALGVDFHCVEDSNRSLNPLRILTLESRYKRLIEKIAPDTVFTFMLKPNIFGVLAARSAHVNNVFAMVEGAGDVFVNNSLKWKVIRLVVSLLYKRSFRYAERVFFLNSDDVKEFTGRRLLPESKCELIHGIGVDLEHFSECPVTNHNSFLMVARMIRTKGTLDYCECARRVKKIYPDAQFNYLGGEGNLTLEDIREYVDDGSINYLGTTKDVRPHLCKCTFLVLPSYREGCPVSVMEAEGVGRGVLTTKTPGCKETVDEGYNGFLVECRDVDSMVEKCIYVIEHPDKADEMGRNSRRFAEERFDSKKINETIIRNIEN